MGAAFKLLVIYVKWVTTRHCEDSSNTVIKLPSGFSAAHGVFDGLTFPLPEPISP
jgi:hypothetical protein